MIKMAAVSTYGKNLKKSSSLPLQGPWPWNLVCNTEYSSTNKCVQMMPLGWPWPFFFFTARSNLVAYAFILEKVSTMDFSKTIVVSDIDVGRCSQLMSTWSFAYQRSGSFIDLVPNNSDSVFLNFISSITTDFNISSGLRWAIQDQWGSGHTVVLFSSYKWG